VIHNDGADAVTAVKCPDQVVVVGEMVDLSVLVVERHEHGRQFDVIDEVAGTAEPIESLEAAAASVRSAAAVSTR
jgi:hypothetical protein